MKIKKAALQVTDTGPVESLIQMLQSVGIECFYLAPHVRRMLKQVSCNNVLEIPHLVENYGYEAPTTLPEASVQDLATGEFLYIDVKAQKNYDKVWKIWPTLANKTVWYRINGGEPENVPGHGIETDPVCPVITPNLWYKLSNKPWSNKSYAFYPPFVQWEENEEFYNDRQCNGLWQGPVSFIHHIKAWGYELLIPHLRNQLGLRCYGVNSPDKMIPHRQVLTILSKTVAMIHPKPNDAPGYALYEAISVGCPIIVSRRLIKRCLMHELLEEGVTCLAFDRADKVEYDSTDVVPNLKEITDHLASIGDPGRNRAMGLLARKRLQQLMWSPNHTKDVESLYQFLTTHFG